MNRYNILNTRYAFPRFEGDTECPRKSFTSAVAISKEEIAQRMDEILTIVSSSSARLESVTNYSSDSYLLADSWRLAHKDLSIAFNRRIRKLRQMVPLDVEILYISDEYRRYVNNIKVKAQEKRNDG